METVKLPTSFGISIQMLQELRWWAFSMQLPTSLQCMVMSIGWMAKSLQFHPLYLQGAMLARTKKRRQDNVWSAPKAFSAFWESESCAPRATSATSQVCPAANHVRKAASLGTLGLRSAAPVCQAFLLRLKAWMPVRSALPVPSHPSRALVNVSIVEWDRAPRKADPNLSWIVDVLKAPSCAILLARLVVGHAQRAFCATLASDCLCKVLAFGRKKMHHATSGSCVVEITRNAQADGPWVDVQKDAKEKLATIASLAITHKRMALAWNALQLTSFLPSFLRSSASTWLFCILAFGIEELFPSFAWTLWCWFDILIILRQFKICSKDV